MTKITKQNFALLNVIRELLINSRTAVNTTMVQTYWQIDKLIVDDEQGG